MTKKENATTVVQCPGCMGLQAVPERYDEIGEMYAHMTGHGCFEVADE